MTFAIPIEDVFAVVDRVDAGQSTNTVHVGPRASLGVAVRPTSPDGDAGAYVVSVQGDGPAARVGIVADTIVVSIDETTISTTAVLDTTLDHYRPGDVVRVGWVGRDGVYRGDRCRARVGPLDVTIDASLTLARPSMSSDPRPNFSARKRPFATSLSLSAQLTFSTISSTCLASTSSCSASRASGVLPSTTT